MAERTILLFDVDGTLTLPRQSVSPRILDFLQKTKQTVDLAVVGGSDLNKIFEQLGTLTQLQHLFNFIFSENGLVGYHGSHALPSASINEALGEDKLQDVINFCLEYISKVKIPVKRGTFIEYRKGMLNVSPIGRSCNQAERDAFVAFEQHTPVRAPLVAALESRFKDYGLKFSIGGQISVDVFPKGWDKTYCLRYLKTAYETIHFFGDKTAPGGNDYEIFAHEKTIGHTVSGPEDTISQISKVLDGL